MAVFNVVKVENLDQGIIDDISPFSLPYYLYKDKSGYVTAGDTIRIYLDRQVVGYFIVRLMAGSSIVREKAITMNYETYFDIMMQPSKPAGAYRIPDSIWIYRTSDYKYINIYISMSYQGLLSMPDPRKDTTIVTAYAMHNGNIYTMGDKFNSTDLTVNQNDTITAVLSYTNTKPIKITMTAVIAKQEILADGSFGDWSVVAEKTETLEANQSVASVLDADIVMDKSYAIYAGIADPNQEPFTSMQAGGNFKSIIIDTIQLNPSVTIDDI